MTAFDTSVRIGRPVENVFAFVSDPLQFPRWNSAVHAVRITSGVRRGVDADLAALKRTLEAGAGDAGSAFA